MEEDKNFVINTVNEITFALIKNSITPNGASKFIADKKLVNSNDVINPLQNNSERNNAFSLQQLRNQSLYTSSIAHSHINPNSNLSNSKLIAITTRKNPLKENFQVPIKKRFRAPNKKLQMEQSTSTPKTLINSSTQTYYTSNKGKGLDVIGESKHEELFPSYDNTPAPLYRENLNRVFSEEFIAQASIKDLKHIIDLVTTQNAETTKSNPMQKMWQPFQPSTSPDLPGKKSTMQYLQKDRPLYIVMHSKDARTKNPSETTTYISRSIYVTPGKTCKTREARKNS